MIFVCTVIPAIFDIASFFVQRSFAIQRKTWGTQMPSRQLFFNSFYFRQVCDTINTGKFVNILDRCCCGAIVPGLLFASIFSSYLFNQLVQLGFATQSTVLSGESRSLLTSRGEVAAFEFSLGCALMTSINSFWMFILFLKWRNDMVNFGDAKYTMFLFLLNGSDALYSATALVATFTVVERSFSGLFFPICKVFLTLITLISLWTHRPGKWGNKEKETLYFFNEDWF